MIYPRSDGVLFLESFGREEDSDAPPLPAEIRRQVIELARSGTKVAQLAETFGMSEATIYNWSKQEKVDRGEVEGLCTDQAQCLQEPPETLSFVSRRDGITRWTSRSVPPTSRPKSS